MSLQLTVPKKQSYPDVKIYYVTSEAHPDKDHHIVVRRLGYNMKTGREIDVYFCDCRDFMIRKLPLFSQYVYDTCKHGEFCRDAENRVPEGHELHKATRETVKSRAK